MSVNGEYFIGRSSCRGIAPIYQIVSTGALQVKIYFVSGIAENSSYSIPFTSVRVYVEREDEEGRGLR